MTLKVELGFTASGASAPFFALDSAVRGVLDSPEYVLGGAEVLVDVSAYVRSVSISRGKSREIDRFTAGTATVSFNNSERVFDPTFEASPFFGQVRPKRQIRISLDDIIQFEGTIDDWDINYDKGSFSEASCTAIDGTQVLANIELTSFTPVSELSGDRVEAVLDAIDWSATKRDIDEGYQLLEADTIPDNTSVFEYLQKVSASESGDLFIAKDGSVKFVGRTVATSSGGVELADDGSGFGYLTIETVFGSELLYNQITLSNSTTSVTETSADSVATYGEIDYSLDTLIATEEDLTALALALLGRFSEPEYRFQRVAIRLNDKIELERDALLGVELGDIVKVTFTPSSIPPAIERFLKVIQINLSAEQNSEILTLGFEAIPGALLVLDDPEFGRINEYALGW
jgi:hypothetical protein